MVPLGLFRAYVRMLPRLAAEASIAEAERTGVGIGLWRSPDGARKAIADWQRVAHPAAEAPASRGLQARRVEFRGGAEALVARVGVEVPAVQVEALQAPASTVQAPPGEAIAGREG